MEAATEQKVGKIRLNMYLDPELYEAVRVEAFQSRTPMKHVFERHLRRSIEADAKARARAENRRT